MSSNLTSDAELRVERQTERLTQLAMQLADPADLVRAAAEHACETLWPHELDTLAAARETMAHLWLKMAVENS